MLTEAVILAGGLGTRLRSKVEDLPKAMAPINQIPFLAYQLSYLSKSGIKTVYLAVGYLSESIEDYFGDSYQNMNIVYVHEDSPLGTGGAILLALKSTKTESVLIGNGDTMFDVDIQQYYLAFKKANSDFGLALKPMRDFDRYGIVNSDSNNKVIGFEEKQARVSGNINGGLYLINKAVLNDYNFPEKFSFEKEFLEKEYQNLNFFGYKSSGYFLDIGIPEDYEKAQVEFKAFEQNVYDKSWTLFLDRDGVINTRNFHGYITSIEDFEFIEGSLEAISRFSKIFGRIVVVTNQQCIGKGIIGSDILDGIHDYMVSEIKSKGGRVDKVYYAPQLASENSIYRKPKSGMADLAKADFPEINFNKSVMVGDSLSDMAFGKEKNMRTVFISDQINDEFDFCFKTLNGFMSNK